jgi:hypothetical protein
MFGASASVGALFAYHAIVAPSEVLRSAKLWELSQRR